MTQTIPDQTDPFDTDQTAIRRGRMFAAIVIVVVTASVLFMALLVSELFRRLDSVNEVQSSTLQWQLSQTEVALLRYHEAILVNEETTSPDLRAVRRGFDAFNIEISGLRDGRVDPTLLRLPDFRRHLHAMEHHLTQTRPLIDGPDAALVAALPDLRRGVAKVGSDMRKLILTAQSFASIQDQKHSLSLSGILTQLAILTMTIITVMAGLILALKRLNSQAQRASEENRIGKAQLEAMITASQDAILLVDGEGRVVEYNGAAEGIFGHSRNEALGRRADYLFLAKRAHARFRRALADFRDTGQHKLIGAGRFQARALRKSGDSFPVEISVTPISRKAGLFVAFLRDMTEQRSAEDTLRRARNHAQAGERAKTSLLAMMSHEIRTPLNGILGSLALLRDGKLNSEQATLVDAMTTSGDLLLKHVNNVLEMSSADAGLSKPRNAPFVISDMLRHLAESQRAAAEARGNSIEIGMMPDDGSAVSGDAARLQQVLLNLIGNANKFTSDGLILIEAELLKNDHMVEFRVTDTGKGIAPDNLARIFEDFVTIDTEYKRTSGGTGLGLPIANRMVRMMGGEMGAESAPDEGSLFWVCVPLPPAQMPSEDPAPVMGPDVRPLDILMIEDNPVNRLVAGAMLRKADHIVTEAEDGFIGLAKANETKFDLILTDISMPGMDGIEVTKTIRAGDGASHDVPIVALTAHALPEDRKRFLEAGMQDILVKPITPAAVHALLGRHFAANPADNSPKDAHSPKPAVNADQLRELAETIGAEALAEHLVAFDNDFQTLVADLGNPPTDKPQTENQLADGSSDLGARAHKLAGSAAVFGMEALRQALFEIEHTPDVAPSPNELSALWSVANTAAREVRLAS